MPIVSLCIPTNGVIEWVFPVLDSIYSQGCDSNEFEVILTDNGNNEEFKEKIKNYKEKHSNLYYFETKALGFVNEIESYKRAKGQLIKFVNHRTCLVSGTLQFLINLSKKNINEKPILYFTNGVLKKEKKSYKYNNFDQFIRELSYWSSWSTGMAIWKEDFLKLSKDINDFNELFPHTTVLFAERNRDKYIIDNTVIFDEIPQGKKPKGNYDLFYAFGVEYPALILDLYRSNSITVDTFKCVLDSNLNFIVSLYWLYFIRKAYCSYNLNGLENMYDIFYTKKQVYKRIITKIICKIIRYKN